MPPLQKKSLYLLTFWLVLSALILVGDYLTGPLILFPILYLIPIALISNTHGRWWGIFLAVIMPLFRLSFNFIWPLPWVLPISAINTAIRMVVLAIIAVLVDRVAVQKRELEKEVQILKGILPICSFCKRIRNKDGKWEILEKYISLHSEAKFSHSICPDCAREHYPGYVDGKP